MQRQQRYLDIGYDRSHLNHSGYNVDLFVDLQSLFDGVDVLVMILNFFCFIAIMGYYAYKKMKQLKEVQYLMRSEDRIEKQEGYHKEIQKEGEKGINIPFMKLIKNSKKPKHKEARGEKGEGRDSKQGKQFKGHKDRQGRDHRDGMFSQNQTSIGIICEKCKYVTEVNKLGLL